MDIKKEDLIVEKQVGKKILRMKDSHLLPTYLEKYPFYDRALPRISKTIKDIDNNLYVIDIGANIGDTVSLITDSVNGNFLCIEGDSDYLPQLKENIKQLKESKVLVEECYCSDTEENNKTISISRTNGTSRIVKDSKGNSKVKIKKLDTVISEYPEFKKTNLLKIDTDGFEISILRGSSKFLNDAKPVLFFEFTPAHYINNRQDPLEIFRILTKFGYTTALLYDNFGKPFEIINTSDIKRIKELMSLIDEKNIYYYDILAYHKSKDLKYAKLFESELFACVKIFDTDYKKVLDEKSQLETQILNKTDEINVINNELNIKRQELNYVYASRLWKIGRKISSLVEKIAPKLSIQRRILEKLWLIARFIVISIKNALRRLKSSLVLLKNKIKKLFEKKRFRKINTKSKKVLYIDHSYHEKTLSTVFFIDLLKEYYDVEIIWDESWKGEPFADLSHVDDSYLAVFFFQNLPTKEVYESIKCENIIFIPMYDSFIGYPYEHWAQYPNLKVINFSKATHTAFNNWGFDSMYIQRFIEPEEFCAGDIDQAFFYSRIEQLNIDTVTTIIGDQKLKLHVHNTMDPNHEFKHPTKKQEKKYDITYSTWFTKKEDKWKLAKTMAIFFASREYEGIGQGYLEGLISGRAVVAVDNPTMNEYIVHNKTGYLYDLKNPQKIDFSNVRTVQKNSYEYMKKGYQKWLKEKYNIIQFTQKP